VRLFCCGATRLRDRGAFCDFHGPDSATATQRSPLAADPGLFSALTGYTALGLAPLHALTVGFCTSLLMAMVTRVTCGHRDVPLLPMHGHGGCFCCCSSRRSRASPSRSFLGGWLPAAIVLWCLSILPWCTKYAPVYWRPRKDGKTG